MSAKPSNRTFVESVLEGEAFETEINDFVEAWHESTSKETLHEFLGFTREEYGLWVEQPETLRCILLSRKKGIDLGTTLEWQAAHRMAARSLTEEDKQKLILWLQNTGRLA